MPRERRLRPPFRQTLLEPHHRKPKTSVTGVHRPFLFSQTSAGLHGSLRAARLFSLTRPDRHPIPWTTLHLRDPPPRHAIRPSRHARQSGPGKPLCRIFHREGWREHPLCRLPGLCLGGTRDDRTAAGAQRVHREILRDDCRPDRRGPLGRDLRLARPGRLGGQHIAGKGGCPAALLEGAFAQSHQ